MAYSVPDLPYAFDALEPHIDARTMEIHHDKHHAAYVTNLNAALEGTEYAAQSLETILTNRNQLSEDILHEVKGIAASYGITILRADVKDLVFPGNLQES